MIKSILSIYNRIKHRSLKHQLFTVNFSLVLIVSTLICLSAYVIFRSIIVNQIGLARVDVLKQIGERTRVIKNSLSFISNLYYFDNEIITYLDSKEINDETNKKINELLKNWDDKYRAAFDKINFQYYVVLYLPNGLKYVSKESTGYNFDILTSNLWYKDVLQSKGNVHWVSSFFDYSDKIDPKYVFSAARTFVSPENGSVKGLMLVNTNERLLYETYKNVLTGKNKIYIVDEKGTIVSSDDSGMLGLNYFHMQRLVEMFGGKSYAIVDKARKPVLISKYKDPESGWMIIEEVSVNEIFVVLYRATFMIALILVIFTVISLILSYLAAKRTTAPLKAFCNFMEQVEKGDIHVISRIQGWSEIQDISNGFNRMVKKVKELLLNIKDEERRKHKAQLDFLQAQINPHFLHNTLFSIKCLISIGKSEAAEEMIADFMDLLKMTLNSKDEFATLDEEITCIRKYIHIQCYRYSNKIEAMFNYDDSLLKYKIPKLILQPVVENAIFHGIEPKQGQGCISISARIEDECLVVDVEDNGIGMSPETIEAIKQGKSSASNRTFNMIGIANVEQRIILNYGSQYGMKIESTMGKGTCATLKFPLVD